METPWRLRPGTVLSTHSVSSRPSRSAGRRAAQGDTQRGLRAGRRQRRGKQPLQSEPEVRSATWRRGPTIQDAIVGSVTESSEDHLARHGGGLRVCPRCRWHKRGADWVCSYGKFLCQHSRGSRENVVWLAERPARFGGEWALGCTICSWFAQRAWSEQRGSEGSCGSSTSQLQRGTASMCRLGSRFARFEVRAECLQAEHFKQHAVSAVHRRVVVAWLNPDAPLTFALQAILEDELLLSGAAPQPADWLRT